MADDVRGGVGIWGNKPVVQVSWDRPANNYWLSCKILKVGIIAWVAVEGLLESGIPNAKLNLRTVEFSERQRRVWTY
jgi:hypothetical protein